jgi:hypothetical protein
MNDEDARDPQWGLVIEIAAKLWIDGAYVVELDPLPTQRFVDLQWAARRAGRVIGGRANVRLGRTAGPKDRRITMLSPLLTPRAEVFEVPKSDLRVSCARCSKSIPAVDPHRISKSVADLDQGAMTCDPT